MQGKNNMSQRCPGCDTRAMPPFDAMVTGLEVGAMAGQNGFKLLCDDHRLMLADAVERIRVRLEELRTSESAVKH